MSNGRGRVVVVGGGIIGTACAYYLSKAGWQVTLIDRGKHGSGCSHANCGFISPSHVLPLAAPGAAGHALRSMLRNDSPLYIRPRFDRSLWSWLWRFARRCNAHDMIESARGIQPLLASSRALYDELLREEPIECEWEARGMLFVCLHAAEMEHYAATNRLLTDSFNLSAKRLDGDALCKLEPALKPGLAGGWFYETDAHLRPDRLLSSWRRVLEARGVAICEDQEVIAFARADGKVHGVTTTREVLPAVAVVVATGAWTPLLDRELGCSIPIQPGKGYSITMSRPARCPSLPMIFEEHKVAITPMKSAYRIGSTMEFAGYDATLNRRRLDLLREAARHYLHEPFGPVVEEEWYGWRPMTYDSKPILDRSPTLANVYVAAGHNMLGLSMAPATGKLMAELVSGATPYLDMRPYAVSRFRR
jgi:D-amino-acid dehydrogenase